MTEPQRNPDEKQNIEVLTVGRLDILLDLAYRSYGSILDNSRSLDVKGSILLALMCIVVFRATEELAESSDVASVIIAISLVLGIAAIVLVLVALRIQKFIALPNVSRAREYYEKRFSAKKIGAQLYANLEQAVLTNHKMVESKAKILLASYIYSGASLGIYMLAFIMEVILND